MDPGNWATDIAGGSRFGYTLLFVIMASNLMAILLQSLSLKLGVATERDLAQLCHESYGRRISFALWIMAEIAIAACDLAEVIGSAIALELLFHIPLFYGVLITGLDVLLILLLQRWGFRYVEALVIALIGTIIALFGVQMFLSQPEYWPGPAQPVHPLAVHRHQPAPCSTSPSASWARRSCRTISTCTPPSCRAAATSALPKASARPSTWPTSIRRSRSPSRSLSTPPS